MDHHNHVLTLIVPSYNMERYLHRCLDSLIVDDCRTMEALDVIIVNDGSKDKTSEIAHDYAERYPGTFRVIDKENGNYGSCINAGLRIAKGKYVRPLDADDYVVKESLPEVIKRLAEVEADVVVTDFTEVNDKCSPIRERRFPLLPAESVFEVNNALCHYQLPMHALSYRTSLLRTMGYRQTEGVFYSDQEWDFLPFGYVRSLYYLPMKLYQYVIGRDGQSVDPVVEQKHMDSNTMILISLLKCFSTVDKNSMTYQYMLGFLKPLSWHIYYAVLLAEPYNERNDKLLREVDAQMKTLSPELYGFLDQLVISFNTRLVHRWRQGKKTNIKILKRIIPFYNLYLRLLHSFKISKG